jgi:tetratricopeptide (TPR) repeat protein
MQRALLRAHVAALEDARRLDPAEVAIRVALGSEHFLLGDFTAARAAYDDALALEPRPEIYLNYGKTWHAEGEEERALSYFARAMKLDPSLRRDVPASARRTLSDPLGGQHDANRAQQN